MCCHTNTCIHVHSFVWAKARKKCCYTNQCCRVYNTVTRTSAFVCIHQLFGIWICYCTWEVHVYIRIWSVCAYTKLMCIWMGRVARTCTSLKCMCILIYTYTSYKHVFVYINIHDAHTYTSLKCMCIWIYTSLVHTRRRATSLIRMRHRAQRS